MALEQLWYFKPGFPGIAIPKNGLRLEPRISEIMDLVDFSLASTWNLPVLTAQLSKTLAGMRLNICHAVKDRRFHFGKFSELFINSIGAKNESQLFAKVFREKQIGV